MVIHKCDICNYQTKYTTNYKRHMDSHSHKRNVEKYNEENNINIAPNNTNGINIENKIMCKYCEKIFTRKSSLHRHLQDNRCTAKLEFDQDKKEKDEQKELVNKLLEEITKMKEEKKKKEKREVIMYK